MGAPNTPNKTIFFSKVLGGRRDKPLFHQQIRGFSCILNDVSRLFQEFLSARFDSGNSLLNGFKSASTASLGRTSHSSILGTISSSWMPRSSAKQANSFAAAMHMSSVTVFAFSRSLSTVNFFVTYFGFRVIELGLLKNSRQHMDNIITSMTAFEIKWNIR